MICAQWGISVPQERSNAMRATGQTLVHFIEKLYLYIYEEIMIITIKNNAHSSPSVHWPTYYIHNMILVYSRILSNPLGLRIVKHN